MADLAIHSWASGLPRRRAALWPWGTADRTAAVVGVAACKHGQGVEDGARQAHPWHPHLPTHTPLVFGGVRRARSGCYHESRDKGCQTEGTGWPPHMAPAHTQPAVSSSVAQEGHRVGSDLRVCQVRAPWTVRRAGAAGMPAGTQHCCACPLDIPPDEHTQLLLTRTTVTGAPSWARHPLYASRKLHTRAGAQPGATLPVSLSPRFWNPELHAGVSPSTLLCHGCCHCLGNA